MEVVREKRDTFKWLKYVFIMGVLTRIVWSFNNSLIGGIFLEDPDYQSYQAAFSKISFWSGLFADSLMLSIILTFREIEEEKGRKRVFEHLNNIFNLVLVFLGLFSLGLMIYLGLGDLDYRIYLLIGGPIVLLSVLRIVFTGFLQMKHGFYAGPRGNLARSLIYLFYLILFKDMLGLKGLIFIGVLAALVQLVIAYFGCKGNDYTYEFKIDFKDEYLARTLSRSLMLLIGLFFMSGLEGQDLDGGMVDLILQSLISALVIVFYPIFVEENYRMKVDRSDSLDGNFLWGMDFLMKIFPLLTIIMFMNMNLEGSDIFEGRFTALFYLIDLWGLMALSYLSRMLMAMDEFKKLALLGPIIYFISRTGYLGSHSLSLLIGVVLAFLMIRHEGYFDRHDFSRYFIRISGYFFAMFGIVFLINNLFFKLSINLLYMLSSVAIIFYYFKQMNKFTIELKK